MSDPKSWRAAEFPYGITMRTRWSDNDMLQHLNNVAYNRMIEAVVVDFTLGPLGIDWRTDDCYPIVIESLCRFHRQLSFPDVVNVRLRAARLGNSSVTYDIAMFVEGNEEPGSTGHFVHVFVDRATQRSVPIPDDMRQKIITFGQI